MANHSLYITMNFTFKKLKCTFLYPESLKEQFCLREKGDGYFNMRLLITY